LKRLNGPEKKKIVTLVIPVPSLKYGMEKTNDMLIDFERSTLSTGMTMINDVDIEMIDNNKYLRTVIDNKLIFGANVSSDQLFFKGRV